VLLVVSECAVPSIQLQAFDEKLFSTQPRFQACLADPFPDERRSAFTRPQAATMASRPRAGNFIWNTNQQRPRRADSVSPHIPTGPFIGSSPDLASRLSAPSTPPNPDPVVSTTPLSLRLSIDSESARRQNSLDRSSASDASTSPLSLRLSTNPESAMARRAPKHNSLDHSFADTVSMLPLSVRMSHDLGPRPAKRQHSLDHGFGEPASTMPLGLRLLDSEGLLRPAKKHKSIDRSSVDSQSIAPPIPRSSTDTESSIPKPSHISKSFRPAHNPRPFEPSKKRKSVDPPIKPKSLKQSILALQSLVSVVANRT
jgi:hypothetical protein